MLGSAVEQHLTRSGVPVWAPAERVPWRDVPRACAELAAQASSFVADNDPGPWSVYWCAGAGVVATSAEELGDELRTFTAFLSDLAGSAREAGSLFLVSSAGGAYAGSSPPPFDESTTPEPLAPYGRTKLAMEAAATSWAGQTGHRVFIGRVANLYGPGQDVSKPQGLVTQLIRAHLMRVPLHIYVSLDTSRDFIFVTDAAAKIAAGMCELEEHPPGTVVTKVVASQQSLTVAAVLGELRRVLHRRPQIVLGASAVTPLQAREVRLTSSVWPHLDRMPLTPFEAGIHATLLDVGQRLQRADLA